MKAAIGYATDYMGQYVGFEKEVGKSAEDWKNEKDSADFKRGLDALK